MALNQQNQRETDTHRRATAMQAKLNELLVASGRARNELAGSEKLPEEEIEALRIRKDEREQAEPPVSQPKTKQIVD